MYLSNSRLKNVGLFWDAAEYLHVSKEVADGKVLYKDIFDNKGPVLYFMNAVALKLGQQNGIIILEFLMIFISLVFLYKTIKLLEENNWKSIIILVIITSILARMFTSGLSCEEYALMFSAIGLYECIKYYKNRLFLKKECFAIGMMCALTFLIRPNLTMVFIAFGISIFIEKIKEKKYKELLSYLVYAFIGFAVVCIPIIIYFSLNKCWYEYIYSNFLLNIGMHKYGIIKSIRKMAEFVPISFGLTIVLFITSIYYFIKKKDYKYISYSILIIITILFNAISVQFYAHYLISFLPVFILAYQNIYTIKNDEKKITFLYTIFISCIIIFDAIECIPKTNIPQPNIELIEYIKQHTNIDDEIAIIGFQEEIYYLSNRHAVSKYSFVLRNNAFTEENQTMMVYECFTDIINKHPKIIIEDKKTIDVAVQPYLEMDEYTNLKNQFYKEIMKVDDIVLYELIKKVEDL